MFGHLHPLQAGSLPSRERGLKRVLVDERLQKLPSLPSRERGLKLRVRHVQQAAAIVAPFTGAWIETRQKPRGKMMNARRSLHGSVD